MQRAWLVLCVSLLLSGVALGLKGVIVLKGDGGSSRETSVDFRGSDDWLHVARQFEIIRNFSEAVRCLKLGVRIAAPGSNVSALHRALNRCEVKAYVATSSNHLPNEIVSDIRLDSSSGINQPVVYSWTPGLDLEGEAQHFCRSLEVDLDVDAHWRCVDTVVEQLKTAEADLFFASFGYMPKVPRRIPDDLYERFTLSGQIPVVYRYLDESVGDVYRSFDATMFKRMISTALARDDGPNYPDVDHLLYGLVDNGLVRFAGKRVVVFGSVVPWYESLVLAFGAREVVVVEYNQLDYRHPSVRTITPDQLSLEQPFDVAVSVSSFEHDGLGRYGDPVDPDGDLIAMKNARRVLLEEGVLILAVPCAMDAVVWNWHRIYGNKRLPLLLQNWSVTATAGLPKVDFGVQKVLTEQPVFVLKKDPSDKLWDVNALLKVQQL